MAIIYTYPSITPAVGDLVLLSDADTSGSPTKTATAQSIANLAASVGNLAVGGTLTVTGASTLNGGLAVTGLTTLNTGLNVTGTLAVTGAQTISTTLGVTGTTTLGVLSLSSISGGWTNAGNIIADLGTVTTADINGGTWQGTIDGGWTAAGQTCTDLGSVTTAEIRGGTIQSVLGGVTPAAATITTLTLSNEVNLGAGTPGTTGQVLTSAGAGAVPTWSNTTLYYKYTTIELNQAQILALNTSPQTLVAAPGAGKVIIPFRVIVEVVYNTAAFATNTQLDIMEGATTIYSSVAGALAVTSNQISDLSIAATGVKRNTNTALTITVPGGDPTGGHASSQVNVHVYYDELTL